MADIKVISTTLLSGHNTVQVNDPMISDSSIFEIYVSDPNIICNNIVVGGTTANITFDSKPTENTSIKVMVNNTSGVLKVPSADVTDGETTQSAINTSVSNSISTLTSSKADLSTLNDRIPSETVLGGVLYHGTTGNEWKVLSGANVNYDSNTTVNEKLNTKQDTINIEDFSSSVIVASGFNSVGAIKCYRYGKMVFFSARVDATVSKSTGHNLVFKLPTEIIPSSSASTLVFVSINGVPTLNMGVIRVNSSGFNDGDLTVYLTQNLPTSGQIQFSFSYIQY